MARNAIRAFRKAIAEDPDYADAYLRLAELYEAAGSSAEAQEARTKAAALGAAPPDREPKATEVPARVGAAGRKPSAAAARYVRMGRLLLSKQEAAAAVEVFRKAIEKDPSTPQYVLTVRGVGYRLADGQTGD